MAKSGITDIQTTQTFQNWFDKTNELVQIVRDDTLTATSGGDVTTGNAILDGDFTAVNLTSNNGVLFTDTIQLADTGNLAININSPILINGSNKIAATYQFNASGAQTRYTDGSLSWDVGLKDSSDYSFIIDTGAGSPEFELTTDGTLLVNNLTVSGNTSFGDGSIKLQAQEAFSSGNGIIFVANTAAELVTIKVDDSAVVRADQDSTMSGDLTIANHDLILETSRQGFNGRIRGFNLEGKESLRLEAHDDGAVIGAIGLNDSTGANHDLKFFVFNDYYATLDTDNFTIDTGKLTVTTRTIAGFANGARLDLTHLSPNAANQDTVGIIRGIGYDANDSLYTYGAIDFIAEDIRTGRQRGSITFSAYGGSNYLQVLKLTPGEVEFPDTDGTVGLGLTDSGVTVRNVLTAGSLKFSDAASETVDIIRDEDDMSSDDANALATQQSIKAYVDKNARTSYNFAVTDDSTATRDIYLTPGDWQIIVTYVASGYEPGNHNFATTRDVTLNSTTVTTTIKFIRTGGAGFGREINGTDIAVGTTTVATAGTFTLSIGAPVNIGHTLSFGCKVTVEKIS